MIQEDYVTIEQVRLLKEKGFPQDACNKIEIAGYELGYPTNQFTEFAKPTLSLVAKWLREEKNIRIHIRARDSWDNDSPYEVQVNRERLMNGQKGYNEDDQLFYSYEDALSAGINRALELI